MPAWLGGAASAAVSDHDVPRIGRARAATGHDLVHERIVQATMEARTRLRRGHGPRSVRFTASTSGALAGKAGDGDHGARLSRGLDEPHSGPCMREHTLRQAARCVLACAGLELGEAVVVKAERILGVGLRGVCSSQVAHELAGQAVCVRKDGDGDALAGAGR